MNNADGLDKTIKSVISQTYHDYEYIVIDGASSDNSVEVIKQYSDKITTWVSESDSGIFNAMNKGINIAKGNYCYFLNSGDYFASDDVLDKIFSKEHSAPFICGNQINDFGEHQKVVRNPGRMLTLYDFYWGTIKHQATFIRRDLFEEYGLYDENLRIISDWKFFLEVIGLHNEQPTYVDIDIVVFAWEGMSTDEKMQKKHDLEREKVLSEHFPPTLREDYNKLRDLKNYEYVVLAMKKSSIFNALTRALVKIFK